MTLIKDDKIYFKITNNGQNPKILINNLSILLMDKAKELKNYIKYKNFEFEKGINLIKGPSGCGKSTLLKIISGFNSNFEGEVIFDSMKDFNQTKKVSYIDGEPFIINDLFLNNITLYKEYSLQCK